MKNFLVVLPLVIFALAEDPDKIVDNIKACAKEFPVDEGLYKKIFDPDAEMPNDQNLNCFLKCLYEKLDLLDENGEIVVLEKLEKLLPESSPLAKMLDECKSIKMKTCEDAYKFEMCSQNALKEILKM